MPKCICHCVHILLACSEDVDDEVRNLSGEMLKELSEGMSSGLYESLIGNLEEKFYNVVSALPRIFNRQGGITFKYSESVLKFLFQIEPNS